MIDRFKLMDIKSGLDKEKKLLAMLEGEDFSILNFIEKAGRLTQIPLKEFLREDNTLDIVKFKDQAKIQIKEEIARSLKTIEYALAPIRDAQALLDDKEIRELLSEKG